MTYCERCGFEEASLSGFHRVRCEEALAYELDQLDAWLKDFEAQPGASEIPIWRAALAAVRRNRLLLAAKLDEQKNVANVLEPSRRWADYYSNDDARRFMRNRG